MKLGWLRSLGFFPNLPNLSKFPNNFFSNMHRYEKSYLWRCWGVEGSWRELKRVEESLGSIMSLGSVVNLVSLRSSSEELRKYAWVRKIVPVRMLVMMGWLGRCFGWGWCCLGRVVSRIEELRKYAWVRKIVPVRMEGSWNSKFKIQNSKWVKPERSIVPLSDFLTNKPIFWGKGR